MNKIVVILAGLMLAALSFGSVASANSGKVEVCHKGKTLSVGAPAVAAHLKHGDKLGKCKPSTTPPTTPPPNTVPPVTRDTFAQVNRLVACASRPVIRVADNSLGITVDLDLATWDSGVYAGVTFTPARFYEGKGASCDILPGFTRNPARFVDSEGKDGGVYPYYMRGVFTL